MNYNFLNKTLHILLLVIFVSHLTFFHNLLANYVICSGSDGHVEIENVNDCDECNDINYGEQNDGVEFKEQHCEDVALGENCFEDEQFFHKDKIIIAANFAKAPTKREKSDNQKEIFNTTKNYSIPNQILDGYTTVSIII